MNTNTAWVTVDNLYSSSLDVSWTLSILLNRRST